MAGVSTIFIAELKEEIEFKKKEKAQLLEQLALYDVRIDRYDALIENMDRSLFPLIDEINVAISTVETAYEARITAGCRSDLVWVQTGQYVVNLPGEYGDTQETRTVYQVQKNSALYQKYGRTGIKYYRRPKNQDYGSNIVSEFFGTISAGSTIISIVQTGIAGTAGILLGDILTDDLENPTTFGVDDLPTIVGFGQSTLTIGTQMFGGSVTIGSTIIAQTGIGSTNSIVIGSRIIGTSVLSDDTTIVGINTANTLIEIFDFDVGDFITTSISVPALVISQPAFATTSANFAIGITSTYQAFFLSTEADISAENTNFTVIRQTQTVLDQFDATNNPIDPVTVAIMNNNINNNSIGYGHTAIRVSHPNVSLSGPFQWREVLGPYDPEPSCGNGFVDWYVGNFQWPKVITYEYDAEGVLLSQSDAYAVLGDSVTVSSGSTIPSHYGIGYYSVSSNNPSFTGCSTRDSTITTAETSRDAIIARNNPIIDKTLDAASSLRILRDKLEGQAFVFLQGRAAADAEIVRLTNELAKLEAFDFSEFEPTTNITKNKFTSSTVGIATT